MGRGRVQLKRIENKINRQVTFSKRRMGLVKKAHEISVLCDAEVALIIFSARGKMFDYASNSSMEKILERYERHCCAEREASLANTISQENATVEQNKLKARIEMLQRSQRHLLGEELHSLSLKELNVLEPQIEAGLKQIRARKDQLMVDSIAELQRKSNEMELQNKELEKKLKEYEAFWQQHKRSHSSSPPSLGRPPSLPLLHWSSQEEEERKTEDQNRPIIPPLDA